MRDSLQVKAPAFPYVADSRVKVRVKRGWFWKTAAFLLRPVNRNFPRFWHAIGNTIYVPEDWHTRPPATVASLVQHELVHVRQMRTLTVPFFALLYTLLPLPVGLAYFRYRFEREAYAVQIDAKQRALAARGETVKYRELHYQMDIDFARDMLTGPAYLWTWPFPKAVEKWLRANTEAPRVVE